MEKRYQVFVSSTFSDLQEERQEVMQALLELDCIPAGMELFPAANDDQWTLIKKMIDDCDYYMVIVAGRYGSLGPTGLSFTEMEYWYALAAGKPVIGFIHRDPTKLPVNRSESDPLAREQLDKFRSLVQQKMCRFWESPADLGSQVSRSLVKLIKSAPAVGWVRADQMDESASLEMLRLRKQIEELKTDLDASRAIASGETAGLAHGSEVYNIRFKYSNHNGDPHVGNTRDRLLPHRSSFAVTWNEVFAIVAPLMIDEANEYQLRGAMNSFIADCIVSMRHSDDALSDVSRIEVDDSDFQTLKVQFRALGLITRSERERRNDGATYWTLTPYGDRVMTNVKAIRSASSMNAG